MTKHVDIRQTGRTLAVPEGITILEAALADGISYPHGCRSGRCGSCKSLVRSYALPALGPSADQRDRRGGYADSYGTWAEI